MQEKKEGIRSMPEGIWESSRPKQERDVRNVGARNGGVTGVQSEAVATGAAGFDAVDSLIDPSMTMDWQGNGYPGQPKSRTESDNS